MEILGIILWQPEVENGNPGVQRSIRKYSCDLLI